MRDSASCLLQTALDLGLFICSPASLCLPKGTRHDDRYRLGEQESCVEDAQNKQAQTWLTL